MLKTWQRRRLAAKVRAHGGRSTKGLQRIAPKMQSEGRLLFYIDPVADPSGGGGEGFDVSRRGTLAPPLPLGGVAGRGGAGAGGEGGRRGVKMEQQEEKILNSFPNLLLLSMFSGSIRIRCWTQFLELFQFLGFFQDSSEIGPVFQVDSRFFRCWSFSFGDVWCVLIDLLTIPFPVCERNGEEIPRTSGIL